MTDQNQKTGEDILKGVSRRSMLRNSVITAAGAVLLPPFMGCRKDVWDYIHDHGGHGGGVGGNDVLAAAAANLKNLRGFLVELYPLQVEYEVAVFQSLNSTVADENWTNFIVDIFIDIVIGITATAAAVTGNAVFIPAIAGLSSVLHDWKIGVNSPPFNAGDVMAQYAFGHEAMQDAIEKKLDFLTNADNNYANLVEAWKDNIEYNGTTYTLADLASSHFPAPNEDHYDDLKDAAEDYYHRSIWNLVIMKCCQYYRNYTTEVEIYQGDTDPASATDYAQKTFYPANPGVYVRGYYVENNPGENRTVGLVAFNLGIGGNPFPPSACDQLFIDDTPGHLLKNSGGLFPRDYVFKQFSITKPDFLHEYLELGKTPNVDFSGNDDWIFSGGMFKNLTK